jgi:hypothetical protein
MIKTRLNRLRITLASLMLLIAACGLVVLVLTPLFRLGPPPCLPPVSTAQWLLARPGTAHCTDCHLSASADTGRLPPHRVLQRTRSAASLFGNMTATVGGLGR